MKFPEGSTIESKNGNIDNLVEKMIHEGVFVGEGKDGVVMFVKLNQEELNSIEADSRNSEETGLALKILKIFHAGEGKREYDIQMQAYELLSADPQKFAQAPKPIIVKVQHLDEASLIYLNSLGTHLTEDVEIILMDFIEGEDLAVHLYNFILEKNGFDPQAITNMSFQEKSGHVGQICNFEFPKNNQDSVQEVFSLRDNVRKFIAILQKLKIDIPSEFIEKIRASLDLLEQKMIFHNDMHERNIIVGKDGNPYIIDFGRSVRNKDEQTSDDMALVRRLKEITSKKTENEGVTNQSKWNKYNNTTLATERMSMWKKILNDPVSNKLNDYLRLNFTNETKLDDDLALLAALVKTNKTHKKRLIETLDEIGQEKLTPFLTHKLKKFGEFIQSQ